MATRQERVNAKRAEYMASSDRSEAHHAYYMWLAAEIGVGLRSVPVTLEHLLRSNDPHFNDISLATWDRADAWIRPLTGGIAWSLSDTVCVLKAIARQAVNECARGEM